MEPGKLEEIDRKLSALLDQQKSNAQFIQSSLRSPESLIQENVAALTVSVDARPRAISSSSEGTTACSSSTR